MKTDSEIIKEIAKKVSAWDKIRNPATDREYLYEIYTILKTEGII